jgi:hypothetical protein
VAISKAGSIRLIALGALCLIGCAGAGKRGAVELDLRATGSGDERAFEFTSATGELTASDRGDKLLRLWVAPGPLPVGAGQTRAVPEGCHGGFFYLPGPQLVGDGLPPGPHEVQPYARFWREVDYGKPHRSNASNIQLLTLLCPRAGAPDGWQTWHADFEVISGAVTPGTVPPAADFAVLWDAGQHELQISSRIVSGAVAVADGASVVRSLPEMFALGVVTGVVPVAADGKYEVVQR